MSELVLIVVVGAVLVSLAVTRGMRRRSGSPATATHRTFRKPPPTPLQQLAADRRNHRERRNALCDTITRQSTLPMVQRPGDGEYAGFATMVADVWLGRDFTLRARAVGLSWLPFVDAPEHHETAEIARERLNRNYRLGDDERKALQVMSRKQAGRIAVTAAHVADSIHRAPVWERDFFDLHSVRVDLTAEITYLTEAAKTLAEQDKLLGPAPIAQRALDAEIVGVYIEKSRILDERIDALLARLEALDAYRAIVTEVQRRADRQDWLDRVNTIDDLDSAASAVADHHHADALRDTAVESRAWAQVYLPNLGSLTARLTAAG